MEQNTSEANETAKPGTETLLDRTHESADKSLETAPPLPQAKNLTAQAKLLALVSGWKGRFASLDRTAKTFIVVAILFIIVCLIFSFFKGVFIAAHVNGNDISRWSVIRELEKQAGKSVLDTLITKKLITSEAKRLKVVVPTSAVDEEIKKAEEQVSAQGGALKEVLLEQGLTIEELWEQILIQKQLEQILAGKVEVTDEEVARYMSATNTGEVTGANMDEQLTQVKEQLRDQKFNQEVSKWIAEIKAKAVIQYNVTY